MSTNATDLGPLQLLIGTWHGQSGEDIAPEPDGTETNHFRERLEFQPVRPFSNAEEQRLVAVQYHQVIYRIKDNKQIHDQSGYFSWDEASKTLIHSFTIPRGIAVIAGGSCEVNQYNKHRYSVEAKTDDPKWPITQAPFLAEKAKTLSYQQTLKVAGSELNYQQTMILSIYGKEFEHTDSNTLIRVA